MDEAVLKITPLTLGYEGKPVVNCPGMELASGEQCLVTGPSGSGKTTLLYAIAGLLPVIKGSIILDNTDITTLPEAQRDRFRGRHIGIIFQTLHLVKSLTVLENLLLASYAAGHAQHGKQAEDILTRLGLFDKRHQLPACLSQGQAQRVAIARAVLHKPALILADEPTSSLDDASCSTVIDLITQAAKSIGRDAGHLHP